MYEGSNERLRMSVGETCLRNGFNDSSTTEILTEEILHNDEKEVSFD